MVDDDTRQRVLDAVGERFPHGDLSEGSPDREQVEIIMTIVEAMEDDQ